MKSKLTLIVIFALLLNSSEGQERIQGTVKSGSSPSQVEVWIRPNFTNSNVRYLFQITMPLAFPSSITPNPSISVVLDPAFVATFGDFNVTVNPLATVGPEKYYGVVLIRPTSTPSSWTAGTEYKVLTATFRNSLNNSAPVRLIDYQSGGSDGQSNFYAQSDNNIFYYDALVASNNFYADPGGESTIGGDASAGYAETTGNVALPVNYLNFSGYKDGSRNILNWTVASENNNRGFDVQRSTDGINYSSIGFVNSQAPGGYSSSQLSYVYNDNSPVGRKQFYRLSQQDHDGRSRLSNVVQVSGSKPLLLAIAGLFPNPARTQVNVLIDAPGRDDVTLFVTDMTGKTVKQQMVNVETGSNTIPVEISNLAQGSYLIKLLCKTSDCQATVAKFNKQ